MNYFMMKNYSKYFGRKLMQVWYKEVMVGDQYPDPVQVVGYRKMCLLTPKTTIPSHAQLVDVFSARRIAEFNAQNVASLYT